MPINLHHNLRPLLHLNCLLGYYWLESDDLNAPDIWLCVNHEKVYDQLALRAKTMLMDSYREHVGDFPMADDERARREEAWIALPERDALIQDINQFNTEVYFSLRKESEDTHPRGSYIDEEEYV